MTGHKPITYHGHCIICGGLCVQLNTGLWRHIFRHTLYRAGQVSW